MVMVKGEHNHRKTIDANGSRGKKTIVSYRSQKMTITHLYKDFFRRQGKSGLGLVIVAQLIEVCCNYHLVIKDQRGRQFIYSNAQPWTRRVLAHLGAWVVDILAPEQHYEEAQPCQPDHKQAWGEYQLVNRIATQ